MKAKELYNKLLKKEYDKAMEILQAGRGSGFSLNLCCALCYKAGHIDGKASRSELVGRLCKKLYKDKQFEKEVIKEVEQSMDATPEAVKKEEGEQ